MVKNFLFEHSSDTLTVWLKIGREPKLYEKDMNLTKFWGWLVINDFTEPFGEWWFEPCFTEYGQDMLICDVEYFCHQYTVREQNMIINKYVNQSFETHCK